MKQPDLNSFDEALWGMTSITIKFIKRKKKTMFIYMLLGESG